MYFSDFNKKTKYEKEQWYIKPYTHVPNTDTEFRPQQEYTVKIMTNLFVMPIQFISPNVAISSIIHTLFFSDLHSFTL